MPPAVSRALLKVDHSGYGWFRCVDGRICPQRVFTKHLRIALTEPFLPVSDRICSRLALRFPPNSPRPAFPAFQQVRR